MNGKEASYSFSSFSLPLCLFRRTLYVSLFYYLTID